MPEERSKKVHAPESARVRRSREAVLRATLDLLTEVGLDALSIDEVARRSGVAKTTVYRHWATRADLVVEACSRLVAEGEAPPDTGSLRGDLTVALRDLAGLLGAARWASVLPSVVDAAERDPRLAQVHATIQRSHSTPLATILGRAAARGEIASDADPSERIAALLGPLYYRRWFSREPLDDDFVEAIVRRFVDRPKPASGG